MMQDYGNRRQGGSGSYGNYNKDQYRTKAPTRPKIPHVKLTEENYVSIADSTIQSLCTDFKDKYGNPSIVTTSKLRNLLAMSADIYNDVVNSLEETLNADVKGRISYLKVRMIYEGGRDDKVKNFLEYADLIKHVDDISGTRRQYILFNRFMEALVAYRKFYVEKDD